ncbi:hypothetical protein APH_0609 [Anaplasma phagocytophilum str. HZ]|uniref:Uncharacterized protein n=1 Tax=Anaplasma phagocytophilum (strain HZ) TaxID=212042 RepID=Q2GKA2_ANAPZ|nr:hypothetical protein APH_0609 [Anaplasma phagocytophilum str. HZ]
MLLFFVTCLCRILHKQQNGAFINTDVYGMGKGS